MLQQMLFLLQVFKPLHYSITLDKIYQIKSNKVFFKKCNLYCSIKKSLVVFFLKLSTFGNKSTSINTFVSVPIIFDEKIVQFSFCFPLKRLDTDT